MGAPNELRRGGTVTETAVNQSLAILKIDDNVVI